MEELKTKGNWNKIKGKLIERYAILTEDDLAYEEGKEEQMLGNLQEKLGKTKREVKDLLRDLGE